MKFSVPSILFSRGSDSRRDKGIGEVLRAFRRRLAARRGRALAAAVREDQATHRQRGDYGELLVSDFLTIEKGFRVLVRNWKSGRDEIDLVCRDGDTLVFVEVKTRRGGSMVPGYFAVNKRKKEALERVCRAYVKELATKPRTFRFDVVEVCLWEDKEPEIHHFETIKLFPKDLRFTR